MFQDFSDDVRDGDICHQVNLGCSYGAGLKIAAEYDEKKQAKAAKKLQTEETKGQKIVTTTIDNTTDTTTSTVGELKTNTGVRWRIGLPPSGHVMQLLEKCKTVNSALGDAKLFDLAKMKAAEMGIVLYASYLPNATRWWSLIKCLQSTIRNSVVIQQVCEESDCFNPNGDDLRVLQEIEAMLGPSMLIVMKITQKHNAPHGYLTLP